MKTYLVTGGTSGIGKCLVSSFKDEDVKLYLTIRNRDSINKIKDVTDTERIEFIDIDLCNVEKIKDALSVYKSIEFDGFIHCAGYGFPCGLRKTTYENFDKNMRVNFYSFVEILKLLTAYKKRESALRVVALSSISALRGSKNNHIYSTTKGALDSFIRSVSLELISNNVEINSVCPVMVDTPLNNVVKDVYGDGFIDFVNEFQPMGMLSPEDVVEQIRFLLNKRSNKVTGTSILVNSGLV